ncbi:MAG: tape measure protein [Bacteroidales bacterium]|jgi:tape measure domain-containing protein|nr:tape measure protein [Bacteroidales bacterium]
MVNSGKSASETGKAIDTAYREAFYKAAKESNTLTGKIINQKSVVAQMTQKIRELKAAYRSKGLSGAQKTFIGSELDAATKALEREKTALLGLQTQQKQATLATKKMRAEYSYLKGEMNANAKAADSFGTVLKKDFGAVGGVYVLKQLGSAIINTRAKFQQIQVSIETMLGGDIDRAAKLTSEIKQYAAISPLSFEGISSATQMMLGFNIQAEKIPTFIKAIGDVSQGNAQRFQALSLAFSQMSASGRLMGQDLLQMINAGFNPLSVMSKKTGKSIAQLKKEMEKGAISTEMVQQAFIDATSAGGKFYQMSEKGAQTINGQISMVGDAFDNAMNSIGKSSQGVIMTGIKGVRELIENYDKLGRILLELAGTYGVYRTALIVLNATESVATSVTKGWTIAELAQYNAMLLTEKAQKALNATLLMNPYAIAAATVAALALCTYKFATYQSEAEKTTKRAQKAVDEYQTSLTSETAVLDIMFDRLKKAKEGTEEYAAAKDAIQQKYGSYLDQMSSEVKNLKDVAAAQKALTAAIQETARARAADTYVKAESDIASKQMTDALQSLRNKLIKEKGEDLGEALFASLRNTFEQAANSTDVKEKSRLYIQGANTLNSAGLSNMVGNGKVYSQASADYAEGAQRLKTIGKKAEDLFGKIIKPASEEETDDKKGKQVVIKNKKFWEDKKQAAQDELDALTDIEAKGAKGTALKREIAQYQSYIDSYSSIKTQPNQTTPTKKDGEKKKEEAAEQEEKKAAEQALSDKQQAQQEYEEQVYELEKSGVTDRIALIELEKERKLQAIQKEEDAYVALEKKAGNDNPDTKVYENRKGLVAAQSEADKAEVLKQEVEEYETTEQKKERITEEYQEKIDDLTKAGYTENAENARKAMEKELSSIDFKQGDKFVQIFRDASTLTRTELVKSIDMAEDALKTLTDPDQIKDVQQQIASLRNELNGISDIDFSANWETFAQTLKKLNSDKSLLNIFSASGSTDKDSVKRITDLRDAIDRLKHDLKGQGIGAAINTITSAASTLGSTLTNLGKSGGNSGLQDIGEQISGVAGIAQNVLQGFASGNWVGAVVSGVSSITSALIDGFVQAKESVIAYNNSQKDFQDQYKLMKLQLNDDDYDTIFGTLSLSKAKKAAELATEALKDYQKTLNGDTTYTNLEDISGTIQSASTSIANMQIKVKDKGWLQNLFGDADVYESLSEAYPDLWNSEGELDTDAAQTLLDTNKQLSDDQRTQIQNAIDLKNAYDDAESALEDEISDVTGSIGDDFASAIWDSIVNSGTDAWEKLEDVSADAIANIAQEMIKELLINNYLSQYEDALKDAFSKGDATEITDVIGQIYSGLPDIVSEAETAAEAIKDEAAEYGITFDSDRTSTSEGVATASQDSVDENNARLTTIQSHTYQLVTGVNDLNAISTEILGTLSGTRAQIMLLRDDVAANGNKINLIAQAVSSMNDNGIYMKR